MKEGRMEVIVSNTHCDDVTETRLFHVHHFGYHFAGNAARSMNGDVVLDQMGAVYCGFCVYRHLGNLASFISYIASSVHHRRSAAAEVIRSVGFPWTLQG